MTLHGLSHQGLSSSNRLADTKKQGIQTGECLLYQPKYDTTCGRRFDEQFTRPISVKNQTILSPPPISNWVSSMQRMWFWWWENQVGDIERERRAGHRAGQTKPGKYADRWEMDLVFPDCGRDVKAYTHARRLPPGREMKESNWKKRRTPTHIDREKSAYRVSLGILSTE